MSEIEELHKLVNKVRDIESLSANLTDSNLKLTLASRAERKKQLNSERNSEDAIAKRKDQLNSDYGL